MSATRFGSIARFFSGQREARFPERARGKAIAQEQGGQTSQYLFVQSYKAGALTPNEEAPGSYTLTLEGGLGETVFFSDRPARNVGILPTPQFLDRLGFLEENPPNAAIVLDPGDGATEIAVVELYDPVYDDSTHTATYQARGLAAWEESTDYRFEEEPADLSTVAASFGTAHLLIDMCAGTYYCTVHGDKIGGVPELPMCWTDDGYCIPCEDMTAWDPENHPLWDVCEMFEYVDWQCANFYGCTRGPCPAKFHKSDELRARCPPVA